MCSIQSVLQQQLSLLAQLVYQTLIWSMNFLLLHCSGFYSSAVFPNTLKGITVPFFTFNMLCCIYQEHLILKVFVLANGWSGAAARFILCQRICEHESFATYQSIHLGTERLAAKRSFANEQFSHPAPETDMQTVTVNWTVKETRLRCEYENAEEAWQSPVVLSTSRSKAASRSCRLNNSRHMLRHQLAILLLARRIPPGPG